MYRIQNITNNKKKIMTMKYLLKFGIVQTCIGGQDLDAGYFHFHYTLTYSQ